jgi:hypothetical protein
MPLTCSHPAAILPFKRLTPRPLNLAALIIGSMSPDFGYFVGQRHLAKLAHYPTGTVLICVPTGLLVLSIFWLLRRDLCYLLPNPHRNQLMPMTAQTPLLNFESFCLIAISLLVGAWTHIIWDQFTHNGNYAFRHFALLRLKLFKVGDTPVTIAYTLQYISTIIGAAILAFCYLKWLRAQPAKPDSESDSWRYLLIFGTAIVSVSIAITVAKHLSGPVRDVSSFREFFYKMGVGAVSIFSALIVLIALVSLSRRKP